MSAEGWVVSRGWRSAWDEGWGSVGEGEGVLRRGVGGAREGGEEGGVVAFLREQSKSISPPLLKSSDVLTWISDRESSVLLSLSRSLSPTETKELSWRAAGWYDPTCRIGGGGRGVEAGSGPEAYGSSLCMASCAHSRENEVGSRGEAVVVAGRPATKGTRAGRREGGRGERAPAFQRLSGCFEGERNDKQRGTRAVDEEKSREAEESCLECSSNSASSWQTQVTDAPPTLPPPTPLSQTERKASCSFLLATRSVIASGIK